MMKIFFIFVVTMTWGIMVLAIGTVYAQKPTLDKLLPTMSQEELSGIKQESTGDTSKDAKTAVNWAERLSEVYKLPQGSPESIIAGIITLILGIGGTLAMLALLVAGVMYIMAQENEEMVNNAKKIITYALIGLIVISVSFAIFIGISRLFL